MKKTILAGMLSAMLLTSATAAVLTNSAVSVTASAESKVNLDRLKNCTLVYPQNTFDGEDYVVEMTADRTVKNLLVVKDCETLYIPAGKTLTLKNGCTVRGTIFIEKGGTLSVKDGNFDVLGSVICDGTLTVSRGVNFNSTFGGILYASPKSTVRILTDQLYADNIKGSTALMGETKFAGGVTQVKKEQFCPKIAGSVRTTYENYSVTPSASAAGFTEAEIKKMLSADWFTLADIPYDTEFDYLSVLFSNGSAIKFKFAGDRLDGIIGSSVGNVWDFAEFRFSQSDGQNAPSSADIGGTVSAALVDQFINGSTNVVRAKLDSVEADEDAVSYWFTAVEQLKGETAEKFRVVRDREWSDEFTQEFFDGEYALFLTEYDSVFTDPYYTLYDPFAMEDISGIVVPVKNEKITNAVVRGTAYAVADDISTMKQLRAHVKADAEYDNSQKMGESYIHSTDTEYIAKFSPYIVKVKVTGEPQPFGEWKDRSVFTVEVEDSYKLALESNTVVLNNGTVEAGGEYIMMLSRYKVGRFENYQPSSKNSIFRADDPEILGVLKKLGLIS